MNTSVGQPEGIVIAIDGPAASGKSSTARAVAARLGYRHLDSGAYYRALTLALLRAGIPTEAWRDLDKHVLDGLGIRTEARPDGFTLLLAGQALGDAIRSPEVTAHVSTVAALPVVREWLLRTLREVGKRGGLVADGRDIGTVVFPDAELKIFLVCAPEERARRRLLERGISDAGPAEIRAEAERLHARDYLDSTRSVAPLRRASDATQLDTTHLSFAEQVQAIVTLAQSRLGA